MTNDGNASTYLTQRGYYCHEKLDQIQSILDKVSFWIEGVGKLEFRLIRLRKTKIWTWAQSFATYFFEGISLTTHWTNALVECQISSIWVGSKYYLILSPIPMFSFDNCGNYWTFRQPFDCYCFAKIRQRTSKYFQRRQWRHIF